MRTARREHIVEWSLVALLAVLAVRLIAHVPL